jgi:hypothetical protein
MKTNCLLILVITFLTACSSASNDAPLNTSGNQNANTTNSTSGASGEAGKAPTPSPSASKDEASKTVTVRFPTGATEASYTDSFSGYGYIDYVFDAKANQSLTAEITKADGNKATLTVMRNGNPVEADASQVQGWTGILPDTGRYTIRVGQTRNEARSSDKPVKFSILIRIVNE